MDKSPDDYHISFFKPSTPQAHFNRKLVLRLVSVWFIAIFGFQIVLKLIEKPTPEPFYTNFEQVWYNIKSGTATSDELQIFGQSTLAVLGKVAIAPAEKSVLDQAMSWSIYSLTIDSLRADLVTNITDFEALTARIESISNPAYLEAKKKLTTNLSPVIGLSSLDIRSKLLPLELSSINIDKLSNETVNDLPGIMKKYLVHNQSFLTDTKFLGFPFHYFYTAVFLLILFVGLCWIYCVTIDKYNRKMGIED